MRMSNANLRDFDLRGSGQLGPVRYGLAEGARDRHG
jgi:hypothetical protein